MKREELNRRDFNRLAAAAFGGVVTGTAIGCGTSKSDKVAAAKGGAGKSPDDAGNADLQKNEDLAAEPNPWTNDKHICRGLNACEGKGADKKNKCAGQGTCATVAHITCGGNNECKYLGGCGETVGQNACAKKGGCHIPLMDSAWKKARVSFETAMSKAGKKFGAAPAKPAKKKG